MSLRAVTFDAADTLIRVNWNPGAFVLDCARRVGLKCDALPARELYERLLAGRWSEYRRINATRDHKLCQAFWEELTRDWLSALGAPARFLAPLMSTADEMLYGGSGTYFALFEDVSEALARLRARGLLLAVISNWDYSLHRILASLGIHMYFDLVVASLEVGVEKPDPEVFRYALRALQVDPEEAAHVGDHPIDDVQGALSAGMRAVRIDRSGGDAGSAIRSLTELQEALSWTD